MQSPNACTDMSRSDEESKRLRVQIYKSNPGLFCRHMRLSIQSYRYVSRITRKMGKGDLQVSEEEFLEFLVVNDSIWDKPATQGGICEWMFCDECFKKKKNTAHCVYCGKDQTEKTSKIKKVRVEEPDEKASNC